MLSSTASPLKRQTVAIPLSMQKMIAKLQFPKKNKKSISNSLPLEYSSGKRRVDSTIIRDPIISLKKTDDSIRNQFANNKTTTTKPARNNNTESSLFENKRKRIDCPRLVESADDDGTSTENADDLNKELPPVTPQKNDALTSKNPSRSLEEVDEISTKCPNDELITTSRSHMETPICPQTSIPPECSNNATITKQNFITTGHEISRQHGSSGSAEENVSLSMVMKQRSDPTDELRITSQSNNKNQLSNPQISAPDECNSTTIEQTSVSGPDEFPKSNVSSQNTKENTISLSTDEPMLEPTNTAAATAGRKDDDDACGFITLNNILQYSGRGSFANELFGDDDEEMDGYTPEFQDKSVQVPAPKYELENNPQLENDILHEKLQAIVQRIRGINDMILEVNKRTLNSSKFGSTLGYADASA